MSGTLRDVIFSERCPYIIPLSLAKQQSPFSICSLGHSLLTWVLVCKCCLFQHLAWIMYRGYTANRCLGVVGMGSAQEGITQG